MSNGIDITEAAEEMKLLTDWGWKLTVEMSAGHNQPPTLVGFSALRDLPGGTIRVSVRRQNDRDTVGSLARDLRDLCSGLKVQR